MERNFTNENMEEFLRRNADGLRMRPSAKVWKGISNHLNKRRRRIGLITGTSLLLITALSYYLVNESSNNFHSANTKTNTKFEQSLPAKHVSSAPVASNEEMVAVNYSDKSNKKTQPKAADINEGLFFTDLPTNLNESTETVFNPTVVDSYFENGWQSETKALHSEKINAIDPLSIESVINSYKPGSTKRFGLQVYFTPTVSYRKLNDSYIDNVATHKPGFGFETGIAAKYKIAKNVKLRAGLQFNVNRYEIKTYESYAQLATIRLTDGNRVNPVTNYNNFNGYKSSWLKNFYLQVSAPVGVEFKIKGDNRMQFGIASTVQPTYLLGDRAYLISSDYRNYAKMQGLVRKWNVNTSLETFVAYSTGHINWQVGPQVRYQMLSSYLKKYPVKENLFDFGLKVGLSVNKQ
jgi:hypothetical protein